MVSDFDSDFLEYASHCHDPILVFSTDGECEFANARACEVFGYSSADLVGSSVVGLFPYGYRTSDRQKLRELFESLAESNSTPSEQHRKERRYTLMGRTKDDFDFPSRIGIFVLKREHDLKIIAIVRATYDDQIEKEALLSPQREQVEQELKTGTLQVKSEFLGMAIHDLRTPIHKISLAADVLLTEEFSEEKKREFLQMIGRASAAMGDLVNDLLDLTKIESGKINLQREPVSLDHYLEDIIASLQMLADQKNISIALEVEENTPVVSLDKKRISQVVNNLLTNAMKFSEEHTSIEVKAYPEKDCVVVEVRDQGPGIPEGEEQKLFEAFSRSSNRPTKGEHSTGLGLAIAKRIIDLHGGEIGVHSIPGNGSTFFFKLPGPKK